MQTAVNLWPLIGVAVIIVGFVLRFNPMLVVVGRRHRHRPSRRTSRSSRSSPTIGTGFIKTRNLPLIILLPLAVIGLLERHGLREHAQTWISGIKAATAGRLLIVYLLVRELTAAVGLTSLGGHPQMVRPLLAPMAEGATEARYGKLPDAHPLQAARLCRGDRQRRPVLRRRHLRRVRRDRADDHLPARGGHRRRADARRAVGHPDRDLRLRHPRASACAGSTARSRKRTGDGAAAAERRARRSREGRSMIAHDQLSLLPGRRRPAGRRRA